MNVEDLIEELARLRIEYQDRIVELVRPLSIEQIEALIEVCRAQSQPSPTSNIAMPHWSDTAKILADEVTYRRAFAIATAASRETRPSQ